MFLRLILSLVTFAAIRFVMYSDQPDLVALRAQLYVAVLDRIASNNASAATDQTELQKLHARVAAEANPCTDTVCPGDGPPADQIISNRPATESSTDFSPKFESVKPKH